ncbi:hypothetical protein BKA93DRAFT_744201 [Sparassis latifolia]
MDPKGDKFSPLLDILVNADTLCLRGTGIDVNPALLSGNVVLHLSEPTSIKEIVLQFRGKARLPVSSSEPLSLSSSQLTYLVCNHEWSFLEGNRSHSHTLKAGRHLFPFQLQIGGSLPSSLSTTALGGASVQYKLRVTATRPGFVGITHRDLQATCPINIIRGFSSEALEYQQTLEIENTWPEKLMYSIMIPHKAWAAGEKVTAVVKFSPLVKGARVLNVTTTINETIKLYARMGSQESTRVVSTTRHDIVDGKAVCVDEQQHRYRLPLLHHTHTHSHTTMTTLTNVTTPNRHSASTPGSPGTHSPSSYFSPQQHSVTGSPQQLPAELSPLVPTTTNSSSSSAPSSGHASRTHESPGDSVVPPSLPLSPPPAAESSDTLEESSSDVVTTMCITIPMHATPSHGLEPIQVTHRVRWSILIGNRDGHTSELRCSLPLHVLDYRLFDEARAATLATRRLLLGAQDVEGGQAVDAHREENTDEATDLPSYSAHVRDRVANAYLPESAVMRVINPWVLQGISPTFVPPFSESSSGMQSPAALETWQVPSGAPQPPEVGHHHLPLQPDPEAQPLEWVNTELLLSLSREAPEAPVPPPPRHTPPESHPGSRHGSRFPSRRGSRANSPERSASFPSVASVPGSIIHGPAGHSSETFVHSGSSASRNMHGLFHTAMKPFTSLSSTFSLGSRSNSHANLAGHGAHSPSLSASASVSNLNLLGLLGSGTISPAAQPDVPAPMTSPELLHRAFTEVPDYDMASRGFLGGGITPLSSMRGLPSYEAVAAQRRGAIAQGERSFSDTNLAGMFAAAGAANRRAIPPRTIAVVRGAS